MLTAHLLTVKAKHRCKKGARVFLSECGTCQSTSPTVSYPGSRVTRWAFVYFGQLFENYSSGYFPPKCMYKDYKVITNKGVGIHFGQIFLHKLIWSPCSYLTAHRPTTVVNRPQMGVIVLFASYSSTQLFVSLKLTLPLNWSARPFIVRYWGGHMTRVGGVT
jgi:hypothetical protein